jgi:putative oxidoreductase
VAGARAANDRRLIDPSRIEQRQKDRLMSARISVAETIEHKITSLREAPQARDVALFIARVALAWVFIYHGGGTLFGLWHGAGITRMATYFASTAHLHPGTLFAYANGITEFFGGIAVGVGFCSRLAAAGLVIDMVMAMITVAWANGVVGGPGGSGYEINLSLLALAAVIALFGPGRYALDAVVRTAIDRHRSRS